ncbi:bolA-like protein 1 [Syngnathoides biaculeatus]|uniref:bolA-like protein 1 n=1 Tax=Syngnathoides biaculeatus TaxID=300417 RepID=UPI002ADDE521|nr:bolA-like protein 1 [Syngnathoides biaculeatus]XP_061677208.1 bolA-like protein 1 [Syngnathoides biaculeatus]
MLPAILRFPLARFAPAARFATRMDPARPVEGAVVAKLRAAFSPEHLEVRNESHMHAVPPGSESHFRVLVVSARFRGLTPLQRHRLVNETLKAELSARVHALAIQAKTPEQWREDPGVAESPPCLGGSRGDDAVEDKLKAGP